MTVQTNPGSVQNRNDAWQDEEMEIDLLSIMFRLIDKWKISVISALVGALLGAAMVIIPRLSDKESGQYTATAKLYLQPTVPTTSIIDGFDTSLTAYMLAECREALNSQQVYQELIARLGLQGVYKYNEVLDMVTFWTPGNTHILAVSGTSSDPEEAMNLANTFVDIAQEVIPQQIENIEVVPFLRATEPVEPAPAEGSGSMMKVIIGFVLGAFLACAVYAVLFLMDDKVRSAEDIEKRFGLTVLGALPAQVVKKEAGK